jgi:hypothetical protein
MLSVRADYVLGSLQLPDTATEIGVLKPVLMKVGLACVTIVALTVYLPTMLMPEFATKSVLPDNASPAGVLNPVSIKLTLIGNANQSLQMAAVADPAPLRARSCLQSGFRQRGQSTILDRKTQIFAAA